MTDAGPLAHANGLNGFGLIDEVVPGLAGGVYDGVVVVEDSVGEPVLSEVLPDVLDGVQFWRTRRQEDQRHVFRDGELLGRVPTSAIEQQDSVSAALDAPADLIDVELHSKGIGIGQRQAGTFTLCRADGAEQIDVLIALICGLPWPGPTLCPEPGNPVLLAYARLVLEPDLDRLALGKVADMSLQRLGEVFLNVAIVAAS